MDENLKKLEESKAQLEVLKESYAAIEKGFKELVKPKVEIKANGENPGPTTQDCINYIESQSKYFWQAISNLQQSIYSTQDSFYRYIYEHLKGHLIPIKSVTQMEKVLEILKLDGEASVFKPMVSVASRKTLRGTETLISFKSNA